SDRRRTDARKAPRRRAGRGGAGRRRYQRPEAGRLRDQEGGRQRERGRDQAFRTCQCAGLSASALRLVRRRPAARLDQQGRSRGAAAACGSERQAPTCRIGLEQRLNDAPQTPFEIARAAVGKPLKRKEDERLITGKGRFTDDFSLEEQTYAALVRSPYPHARIMKIDVSAAKAMPGVLGVFTGADALADGLTPIPHTPVPSTNYDMKLTARGGGNVFIGPHRILPADKVRHVGEAVAMVVAETKAQALDAGEAVAVEYEELPSVASAAAALAEGAPAIWDDVPDNVLVDTLFGNKEKTDRAFAEADPVVKMEFDVR